MPLLQRTLSFFRSVFQRSGSPCETSQHDRSNDQNRSAQHFHTNIENLADSTYEKCNNATNGSRKRKALDETQARSPKRVNTHDSSVAKLHGAPNEQDDKQDRAAAATATRKSLDRDLMPPPPTTQHTRAPPINNAKRVEQDPPDTPDVDSDTQTRKAGNAEVDDDFDMAEVRRRIAETPLPSNIGTWEPSERELFWHLSRRGCEPLLPQNWMVDFGTLPLQLFAFYPDQEPLIKPHRSNEFPAIRALRELLDTGQKVRDRKYLSNIGLPSEPIIEKAARRYIKWALKDVGIKSKQCIPVHAIATRKQGHDSLDTIRELALKMHKLSSRHREACNILASIEQDEAISHTHGNMPNLNDFVPSEHRLPTIYGLMITSGVVGIFTTSSHTLLLPSMTGSNRLQNEDTERASGEANSDLAPRFVAQFDFDTSASDVWNAFAIAIFAMMVRKTLLNVYEIPAVNGEQDCDESIIETSMIDESIDGGRETYTTRYAAGSDTYTINAARPVMRVEEDSDPDL